MELPAIRPIRPSKMLRRMSVSSQMRGSGLVQNRNPIESPKNLYQNNNSQFQPVFDLRTGLLNPVYCDSILKNGAKAMMHIGVCLSSENIMAFLKMLFNQNGKSTHWVSKISQRREQTREIFFIPFLAYKIESCSIVFWFLEQSSLQQLLRGDQKRRILQAFITYPQIIVTDTHLFQYFRFKKINLAKQLNFQQQVVLLGHRSEQVLKNLTKDELQKCKIQFANGIDQNFTNSIILQTLKKNSARCFQEILKINLYILESLASANTLLNKEQYDLSNEENHIQILQLTASKYLSEEVQRQYDSLAISLKNAPPKNQKQLQAQLNLHEQNSMKEVKKNIRLLKLDEEEKKYFEPAQKIITVTNQQILTSNRQQIKRQNNELLTQLYQKLLSQFDKGRYSTKDRIHLMAHDLQSMMHEYEKKAVKSNALFWIFNTFMRNNRGRYYQKIQSLQQQADNNKRSQTFDEIFDKIQIKKKVLLTLEREVRNLQNKKATIQSQNEHLKKLQKEINERVHFESEMDEIVEADSMKTIKTRSIVLNSPQNINSKLVLSTPKIKSKPKVEKTPAKKGFKKCCNCTIF